ncbi:MAG: hypothetical protein JWN76_735 [Chitinophagaceae bacterium]|nr:hypothetical protein [Chitinophagaceae bacterium]
MNDYKLEIRKFISSQYLYFGIRITACILIPSFVLYHYGLLASLIGIPLGAAFVGTIDNPGTIQNRAYTMIGSIVLNFVVIIITVLSNDFWWLIAAEILIFGMAFSLLAVYGNRFNSVGIIALFTFIIHIESHGHLDFAVQQGLSFTYGGIWYAILSLTLTTLRPYKPIQQLLGECLMEIGSYLQVKARFYEKEPDFSFLYSRLMQHQVSIHKYQNDLQEIIFRMRQFMQETTNKGRVLMMIFLDSMDLQERIMTSQQDYIQLHKEFENTGILEVFKNNITVLSNALHNIGLALQAGYSYRNENDLDETFQYSMKQFMELRKEILGPANIESFIKLRHILHSIQDITERIKRLEAYTTYDKTLTRSYKNDVAAEKYIQRNEFNYQLFFSNFSLQSGTFRHALRLTLALLTGYIISLLFPLGHGYWILLTIAAIIKPAYSITRQRNFYRLGGTLIGALIGFSVLSLSKDNALAFIIMIIAMVTAYSFLKLQYMVSTVAVTVYVLISLHFLNPAGTKVLLTDRIIDTAIGSVIAYVITSFVLPAWEHQQIENFIKEALRKNIDYFKTVAYIFIGKPVDLQELRLERKEAFVALANLSDNFQRMLSEPKTKQPHLEQYHQFVTASHMLTSHIAALSYNAQRYQAQYAHADFEPTIKQVEKQMMQAEKLLQDDYAGQPLISSKLPVNKKVQNLLELRQKELVGGNDDGSNIRKTLSDLKTITDQFQLINSAVVDEVKILQQIKKN